MKKTKSNDYIRNISLRDANRAIYIDFEGFVKDPPSLLGVLRNGLITQFILDDRLKLVPETNKLKHSSIKKEITQLVERCKKDNRCLIGYTFHERDEILEYTGIDISDVYINANLVRKEWCKKNKVKLPKGQKRSLTNWCKLLGLEYPPFMGNAKATKKIKRMIDQLDNKKDYEKVTGRTKTAWKLLLDYNKVDCYATWMLMLVCSNSNQLD